MSTTASEVDICNMALGWIGGDRITSLDDDSTRANLCKLNYPRSRDVVLESREWTFAVKQYAELTPDPVAPEFRWGFRFKVPTEVIRVISVDDQSLIGVDSYTAGMVMPEQIPWVLENNYILCNFDVIYVRALIRITSTAEFTEAFAHAVAARLAADLSVPLTQSMGMHQQMYQLYLRKLNDAAATDGMQGRSQRIRSRYLAARR